MHAQPPTAHGATPGSVCPAARQLALQRHCSGTQASMRQTSISNSYLHERQAIPLKVLHTRDSVAIAIQAVVRLSGAPEAEYQMQIQARQPGAAAAAAAGPRHFALLSFLSLLHALHQYLYSRHAGAANASSCETTCISRSSFACLRHIIQSLWNLSSGPSKGSLLPLSYPKLQCGHAGPPEKPVSSDNPSTVPSYNPRC